MRGLTIGAILVLLGCSSGPSVEAVPTTPASNTPARLRHTAEPQDSDVVVGGAAFDLVLEEPSAIAPPRVATWVERSAGMIADYYGGEFPVPDLRVEVVWRSGAGVGFGQHWGGRRVKIRVGGETTDEQLEDDWVLVHEMLHACFPDLPDEYRWMQEGLSTYLEPVVRARADNLEPADVWGKWVRNMSVGQPRAGDRGLMKTRTWARTYWGGALFWLMIDFELRKRTDDAQSLRTALRGIVARGGTARVDWTPEDVVRAGDEITGTTVFRDVFDELAMAPGRVDLDEVWRQLGVVPDGDEARFDENAPLASIRVSMTR